MATKFYIAAQYKMKEKMKKLEQTPETSIWLSELQELKTKIKF